MTKKWFCHVVRNSHCLDPRNREKLLWFLCGFFLGTLQNSSSIVLGQVAQVLKNLPAMQETRFDPWVGKMPWRREWQYTLGFLPGEFHGQRSLIGYSPWNHKVGHDWATNKPDAWQPHLPKDPLFTDCYRNHFWCRTPPQAHAAGEKPLEMPIWEDKGTLWLYFVWTIWITDPWMSQEEGRQPQCEPRCLHGSNTPGCRLPTLRYQPDPQSHLPEGSFPRVLLLLGQPPARVHLGRGFGELWDDLWWHQTQSCSRVSSPWW